MRTIYRKTFLVLLSMAFILGACNSLASQPAAPSIPGLAQTLAAETLTALDIHTNLFATPQPPGSEASQITFVENLTTPTPESADPAVSDGGSKPQTTEVKNPEEGERCSNLAEFVEDVTIPDNSKVNPNERFIKTWKFKNAGTCTWTPEYSIVFMWGEAMDCPARVPINATVPPGETLTISVPLTAPKYPMEYQGNWLFDDGTGARFGTGYKGRQFFWVAVNVGGGGGPGSCVGGG